MSNHVAKINTPPSKPSKTAPIFLPEGEECAVINQVTGNLILQPGRSNAVIWPKTGKSQEYRNLIKVLEKLKWSKGISNEIGQLFQGIGDIQGTNTCFFIHRHEVPQDAKVTYFRIVYNIWHQKKETRRVWFTVGWYRLTFDWPVSTPISEFATSKLH